MTSKEIAGHQASMDDFPDLWLKEIAYQLTIRNELDTLPDRMLSMYRTLQKIGTETKSIGIAMLAADALKAEEQEPIWWMDRTD